VPPEVANRIAEALDRELDRPYEALAVRQSETTWTAGGRKVAAELVRFPRLEHTDLEVALTPDGEVTATADGTSVWGLVEPELDEALREMEARGRARFEAFVARADNLDGERWELTIDPL
jgi:hypothetical protein